MGSEPHVGRSAHLARFVLIVRLADLPASESPGQTAWAFVVLGGAQALRRGSAPPLRLPAQLAPALRSRAQLSPASQAWKHPAPSPRLQARLARAPQTLELQPAPSLVTQTFGTQTGLLQSLQTQELLPLAPRTLVMSCLHRSCSWKDLFDWKSRPMPADVSGQYKWPPEVERQERKPSCLKYFRGRRLT